MLKKIQSALTHFIYLIIIGLIFYIGWNGWYKLCTPKERRKNGQPVIYAGIHTISLFILLLVGSCANDLIQDILIFEFVRWTLISLLFIIIGAIMDLCID